MRVSAECLKLMMPLYLVLVVLAIEVLKLTVQCLSLNPLFTLGRPEISGYKLNHTQLSSRC